MVRNRTDPQPKDQIENTLNHSTCAGLIPLVVAQAAIARQWVTAVADAGLALVGTGCACALTPHGALGDERDHHCRLAGRGRGGHVRNRSDGAHAGAHSLGYTYRKARPR